MHNKLYINWIDGMKINKSHFLHTDQANSALRTFNNQYFLSSYEYGLGEYYGNMHKDMIYLEDTELYVNYCHAITNQGVEILVEKDDNLHTNINQQFKLSDNNPDLIYLVILSVDLQKFTEMGNPDPDELPPRFPYRKHLHTLSVVPHKTNGLNYNKGTSICIGKLIPENNRLIIDEHFIPSCSKVNNHQELMNQYIRLEKILDEIHSNSIVVVQNAISKKKHGEINDLATNTFYIMEKIVFFLSAKLPYVRTIYKEQSPIYIFNLLNCLAKTVLASLACIKREDKEALLRYFESHLGFKPHQFESEMKALADMKYKHFELQECFVEALQYLETIRTYVSKSTQLEFHSAERVDVLNETVIKKRKLDIF